MSGLIHDLRYALRQLRKAPGFSLIAVLTLSLGIGATVAIFAFVDAALLKPLPYGDSSRLVDVTEGSAMFPRANLSYLDYVDWKKMNTVFSSMDVWHGSGYLFQAPNGAVPVSAAQVSDGFFRTLGVKPALGRDFYEGEDKVGAPPTVLLSAATWRDRFSSRPDILGQTVMLSGKAYTIIGVLPKEFQFALRGRAEFWTALQPTMECEKRRSCHNLYGVARLKDGVTVAAADANLNTVAKQLENQYPDSNRGQFASVITLSDSMVGNVRPLFLMLLTGAGLLFFIACVNVASLLLVRSESRRREMAVRGALGASAGRLFRQFVTEGMVLTAAGIVLGLVLASWAVGVLIQLIPADMFGRMPYLQGLGLSFRVILFAVAIALVAGVVFAIAPALRTSFVDLRSDLAEGGRGAAGRVWRKLGANLVTLELATAVILLVSAGLLGKSFFRLLHVDLGFDPGHVASLLIIAPDVGYEKEEQQIALANKTMERFRQLPGVQGVALTSTLPVSCNCNTNWIRFVGKPYSGEHNEVNNRAVTPEFFSTIHAKLLNGRFFTESDDSTKPLVSIINKTLAQKYFPGEDPIGRKYGDTQLSPKSLREIVGVVDDVRDGSLDAALWPAEYVPFKQNTDSSFYAVVRTSENERSLLPTLVSAVRQVDPALGTQEEMSMNDKISDSPSAYLHRSSAWLVGGFAGLALVLGVVGLYGVIAYSVSQRTREIGVRMALGAQRTSVYQLVLKEAGRLAAVGITLGLAGAVAGAMLMRGLLFGVSSWDVPTLAGVAVLLGAAALLASYIPARRAARVDPIIALRCE
ncbi:MAG TPA: ABC transporter permease [Candidatus Acidoferrum sp.]|nr:ABC transporter permease [Candidatus Acidoferrum sp.]